MANTPENRVKNAVRKILEANGVYYFMPSTGGYGRSGIPDIIACVNGQFLAIECKAIGKHPTALQERELARIDYAGGKTLVITGTHDAQRVEAWLKLFRTK